MKIWDALQVCCKAIVESKGGLALWDVSYLVEALSSPLLMTYTCVSQVFTEWATS